MASVLAIISKAQFEKSGSRKVGDRLAIDRYLSTGKGLDSLAGGGALFLVTVRPGDVLWLVGILESPKKTAEGWLANASDTPITDVSALKARLKFASGTGITAKPGALGMSLQTPRELTDADVSLLRAAVGGAPASAITNATAIPTEVPDSLGEALAQARAAAPREPGRALAILLALYRAHPADPIADAIEAVGARAQHGRSLPTGKTTKERNEGWLAAAAAGDPVMRGLLAESIADTKGSAETLERIEKLIPHLPDPRVSARIADLIEVPRYNASVSRTAPFWKRAFALLPELGDPRIRERAEKWPALWAANKELNEAERPELQKRLDRVLPALREKHRVVALDAADTARVAEIVAALGAVDHSSERTEESLLAEVYADPVSDAPRLVYADWLQERNDPRGEFIVLQFARRDGTIGREGIRRENELLAEYGHRFLGSLEGKVKKTGLKFERGFLDACEPSAGIDDDAAWSTVSDLSRAVPKDGQFPRLRVLRGLYRGGLAHVAKLSPLPLLQELHWSGPDFYDRTETDERSAIAAFRALSNLPALERLYVDGSEYWAGNYRRGELLSVSTKDVEWLWTSPASANLEILAFPISPLHIGEFVAALDATRIGKVVFGVESRSLESSRAHLVLERGRDRLSRATLHIGDANPMFVDRIAEGLERIPSDLFTAVHVRVLERATEHYAKQLARVRTALDRQTKAADRSFEQVGRITPF